MTRSLIVVIVAVLVATLAAQDPPSTVNRSPGAEQPPRPAFRTEANYVRVDAYPTKDGVPVTDLTKDDFEVFDERVPQTIEQFEHVVVRGNLPQEMRREPQTVAESRAALQNSRARVFVVFLDVGHVEIDGSYRIRQPLIDALNHLIGEDDLVALMTPEMSALDLAFARKTTTIEGLLTRNWPWGERDRLNPTDPVEKNYESCFGPQNTSSLTRELIARRREKQTIDALQDLVRYLRGAREERKAVIAITDGWVLYGPNEGLANQSGAAPPPVFVNPGTGRLQVGDAHVPGSVASSDCQRDLMFLARIDDRITYRALLNEANFANTSFYPLDPRGLPVFDTPITQPQPPLGVDAALLRTRAETLRTLAENTDGLAMLNSNDLDRSFRRIVADLSSYYLLGYYSTGRLDGRFHSITVRVKRSGVQVRARRGYQAALPPPAPARTAASAVNAVAPSGASTTAIAAALAPLAAYGGEPPIRAVAAAGWTTADPPRPFVSVVGELSAAREFEDRWKAGAAVAIELASSDGPSVASARTTIAPAARTFRIALAPSQPIAPGDYVLRVSARSSDDPTPMRETVPVAIPAAPQAAGATWSRRGQSTGNRDMPTADLRFHRSEQVQVEFPAEASEPGTAQLLDRTGKPLAVPVTVSARVDADGSRWVIARLGLAPLAAADYLIQLSEGTSRRLVAFRVIP